MFRQDLDEIQTMKFPGSISLDRKSHRSLFSWAFLAVLTLLGIGFVMVGGARDDLASLLLWRPVSILILALAVGICWRQAWANGRQLMLFGCAMVALILLQLLPLPPFLWTALPGHDVVAANFRDAGMDLPWQSWSMVPARTWNALFALAGPAALLILVLVLPEQRQRGLLVALIAIGFVSGVMGLIQAIGPADGPLYYYRITNGGASVGMFANRNHQAVFLATLYPLLAANLSLFSGKPDKLFFQRVLTIGGGVLLVPLILMTGSRAGLFMAVIGLVMAWWVYRAPSQITRAADRAGERQKHIVTYGLMLILLAVVVLVAVRTPALERLLETDTSDELRITAIPTILRAVGDFFPFGSGVGTFVEIFQLYEPDSLISAQYFNHAHNDALETLLTAGLFGAALMIWFAGLILVGLRTLWRNRHVAQGERGYTAQIMGRAGLAILMMLAVYSFADYPLRVPSFMLLAVVSAAWASTACRTAQK